MDRLFCTDWTPMNAHLLNTFYDTPTPQRPTSPTALPGLHLLHVNTFYETAPLSMQCNQSDGNRFPVSDDRTGNESFAENCNKQHDKFSF